LNNTDNLIVSEGTTLNATHPITSVGTTHLSILCLKDGQRKWFHSGTAGLIHKGTDPNSGAIYVTSNIGLPNSTSSFQNFTDNSPFIEGIQWRGILKLSRETGEIEVASDALTYGDEYKHDSSNLRILNDGSLIFYDYTKPQAGSFYGLGNKLIFADANFNVGKVYSLNTPGKISVIAANNNNFAVTTNLFNANINIGGTTLIPFEQHPNFASDYPSYSVGKSDAFIAQGEITQIPEQKTTAWTGNISTDWADAANWSNGVPNEYTKVEFNTNTANQPVLSSAKKVGIMEIKSGVTVSLAPSFLSIASQLILDGTLNILNSNTTSYNGFGSLYTLGTGTLAFNGTGSSGASLINFSHNININTSIPLTLNGTISSLTLSGSGKITTSGLQIASADANAITGYSETNFMTGKLTRAIAPGNSYVFPVALSDDFNANTLEYAPVTINTNNITTTSNLTVEPKGQNVTNPDLDINGAKVNRVTNNGFWAITLDVQPTSGTYHIALNKNKATNGDALANKYVILKSSPSSENYGFEGTLGDRQQTGGTGTSPNISNASITVEQSDLSSFSNFIIAVLDSEVTTLTTSETSWSGAINTTWDEAGNWTNGIPSSLSSVTIPAGLTNYPLIYPSSTRYLKNLKVESGANVNLSNRLSVSDAIVNNGIITINKIPNSQSSLPKRGNLIGSGKVVILNPNSLTANQFENSPVNCDVEVNISDASTITLTGTFGKNLNIVSGRTSTTTEVTFTQQTSIFSYTSAINVINGTYTRPIAESGSAAFVVEGTNAFAQLNVTNKAVVGVNKYSVKINSSVPNDVSIIDGAEAYTSALNFGQLAIIPNTSATAGKIDLELKISGFNNGRATVNDYILLRKDPSGVWTKVDQVTFTQNEETITVTAVGVAPLKQTNGTNFCIGLKATTTTWTGAVNNSWTAAGNWSNGVPSASVKAIFNTQTASFPTTNVPTNATGAALIEVASGKTISLPSNFLIPIVNNGTIEVTGTGTFSGFGTGSSNYKMPSGNGILKFTNNSPGTIDGSYFTSNVLTNGFEFDRSDNITLGRTINTQGNIILTSGKVTVATNQTLRISNPMATITAAPNSYIIGKIERKINANGTYILPVGSITDSKPAVLTLNNVSGINTIVAQYLTGGINGQPNLSISDGKITSLLSDGSWEIHATTQMTGGSYSVSLSSPIGSSTANNFTIIKREGNYNMYTWGVQGNNPTFSINNGVVSASVSGLTSFSQFGIGEVLPSTLPVVFNNFSGKAEASYTSLSWSTQSEENSNKFIVEKSANTLDFLSIGEVKARGKSTVTTHYNYKDSQPLNGINYYRLKQVDGNGDYSYSEVIAVQFALKSGFSVYPNPVSSILNFSTTDAKQGVVWWYNYNGQKVAESKLSDFKTNVPQSVSSGNYLIRVLTNHNTTHTHKISVVK
jgi:hypothetical protein